MGGITVAIFNESTVVQDGELAAMMEAFQTQVGRDFSPVWGHYATLQFVPKGGPMPKGAWPLGIFDTSDQAGALGYHIEDSLGIPAGKVFAQSDLQYGSSLSVTITHELLEMLADPWTIFTAPYPDGKGGWTDCALEVADAVEDDSLAYKIGDVLVTNFVTPHWFDPSMEGAKVPFDFCGKCTEPFQILSGGYIGVKQPDGTWTQVNARGFPHRLANAAPLGSRRERRGSRGQKLVLPITKQERKVKQADNTGLNAWSTAHEGVGKPK